MSKFSIGAVVCGLCLCVVTAGCGGGGTSDGPKRYPVRGTITWNSKPVMSGTISFGAMDAAKGTSDSAVIGKDGSYQVERGLAEGDYTVIIQSYKRPIVEIPPPELVKLGDSNLAVPKKYTDVKTTDLKLAVKRESTTANFELKD